MSALKGDQNPKFDSRESTIIENLHDIAGRKEQGKKNKYREITFPNTV